jgi:hypothetical protein
MITSLQFKVFERMHGRTVASAVAASTARSAGQVSERTVRNWLGNRTTPEPETLEQVVASSRAQMLKSLETSPWPAGEREALVETLDACPGFVSGFAATLQNGGGKYPVTIELARKIDLLEQALGARRSSNDLGGWVKTLLKTPWVQDEHLTHPDNGTDAEATRRMLLAATSWDDLILPVAVVAINIQFQLLATLDLEFCASYLPDLEATPIFASLLPRLHPQAEPIIGTSKTRRDLFQSYPAPSRRYGMPAHAPPESGLALADFNPVGRRDDRVVGSGWLREVGEQSAEVALRPRHHGQALRGSVEWMFPLCSGT